MVMSIPIGYFIPFTAQCQEPRTGADLLEVFDAARHAQPTTRAPVAYPFVIGTKPSDMPLGSMQGQKESDPKRVGRGGELDAGRPSKAGVL